MSQKLKLTYIQPELKKPVYYEDNEHQSKPPKLVGYTRERKYHEPISAPIIKNSIEVRAKDVPETLGVAKHVFIVYTDGNGKQQYFSGYPLNQNPTNFGPITIKHGEYAVRTPDYVKSSRLASITGDPKEVKALFEDMKSRAFQIERNKIPYTILIPNHKTCNTVANHVLTQSLRQRGINFKLPTDIWTPGSEINVDNYIPKAGPPEPSPEQIKRSREDTENSKRNQQREQRDRNEAEKIHKSKPAPSTDRIGEDYYNKNKEKTRVNRGTKKSPNNNGGIDRFTKPQPDRQKPHPALDKFIKRSAVPEDTTESAFTQNDATPTKQSKGLSTFWQELAAKYDRTAQPVTKPIESSQQNNIARNPQNKPKDFERG